MRPKTYEGKSLRPGGGGKFERQKDALMRKGMSEDRASAITAAAGRKKYGAEKMAKWASAGRRRAARLEVMKKRASS